MNISILTLLECQLKIIYFDEETLYYLQCLNKIFYHWSNTLYLYSEFQYNASRYLSGFLMEEIFYDTSTPEFSLKV